MFDSSICNSPPATAQADAGIAGIGILLAFLINTGLGLALSAGIIFSNVRGRTSRLRCKTLGSVSDAQLLLGIVFSSVGLSRIGSIVSYHFFIIWLNTVLSNAVHAGALLSRATTVQRDRMVKRLRYFLMFTDFALSFTLGILMILIIKKDLPRTLPVQCTFHIPVPESVPSSITGSIVGTVAIMVGLIIIFVASAFYLHTQTVRHARATQVVGIAMLGGIGISTGVRLITVAQAFHGDPGVELSGASEGQWAYGQLVTMFLLVSNLIGAFESWRDVRKEEEEKLEAFDRMPFNRMNYYPGGGYAVSLSDSA